MSRVMRVEPKLGVLEKFWLAGFTAPGLWAVLPRAGGSGACRQHAALCAGDAPTWPQSASAEGAPNLNPGLGLHKLPSPTERRVHWQVSIPRHEAKKLQADFAPVIRQHRVGTGCPATYTQSKAFLYKHF